jgi:hypothetical protein
MPFLCLHISATLLQPGANPATKVTSTRVDWAMRRAVVHLHL